MATEKELLQTIDYQKARIAELENRLAGLEKELDDRRTVVPVEAKFQSMVENLNQFAIFQIDPVGNFVYLSPGFKKLTGYDPEELINQPFAPLVHPEDLHLCVAALKTTVESGQPVDVVEYRTLRKEGTLRWHSASTVPLRDDCGRVIGLIGVGEDISDRKAAEAALLESEAKFRTLVENLDSLIFMADQEGRITYASPAYERLLGYTPAEIQSQFFLYGIFPEDQPKCLAAREQLMTKGQSLKDFEYRIFHKDGSLRWMSANMLVQRDKTGQVIGFMGIADDISDRIAAEEALKHQQVQLQTINAYIPGVLYQFKVNPQNNSSEFTYISPGSQELYELPPEALIGNNSTALSLVHPDDLASLTESVSQVIQTPNRWLNVHRIITPSGKVKWVQVRAEPAVAPDGTIIFNGLILDISDRIAAEEALKHQQEQLQARTQELEALVGELKRTQLQMIQSEKMSSLGQMVAGVAHEINNPVNFIHGNLSHVSEYIRDLMELIELYEQHYPEPSTIIQDKVEEMDLEFMKKDLQSLLQSMNVGTNRIREIVLSLRNFSRLDESEVKDVDIHDGINSTLTILQNRLKATATRPEIKVVCNYGDLPRLECYAGQLNQVFMNILSNAIDALEEKNQNRSFAEIAANPSLIEIKTTVPREGWIRIEIADNGPGIPEEVRSRLFDPFFTTKPVGKGTGLGLSISYQIITERHNGAIQCESSPGLGTKFIIELPTSLS